MESASRVIATGEIKRTASSGGPGDYTISLQDDTGASLYHGEVVQYPRYASTVWDLVARGIAGALTGEETLPPRPTALQVPVHVSDGTPYVRFSEIPEPARSLFEKNVQHSTRPIIEDDLTPMDCAYAWDWRDFLGGVR